MSLGGFDIKIDPSWILIAALVFWSLGARYFPAVYPDQSGATYLTMALVAMLGFFASLVLHEMAHSVVARRHGVDIASITLFLLGGVAELKNEPRSGSTELRIALAGPGASLLLGVLFGAASALSAGLLQSITLAQVFGYLSSINLILAIFNMLPAFPLDGGRVLRALLWMRHGDALRATETASRIGSAFAILLIGFGFFTVVSGFLVSGLWQIVLGVFLYTAAQACWHQQLQARVLAGRVVADVMTRDPRTASPEMHLEELVDHVMLKHRVSFVPVVEDGVLLGSIDGQHLARIDRDNWRATKVGSVFAGLDPEQMLEPGAELPEVFDRIARTGRRKFLVVRNGRLLGVVTLADLSRYLGIARLLGDRRPPE